MPVTTAPTLPSRIRPTVELYPHQIEGVRWLRRRPSFILADDMGLGKSLQALIAAALDAEARPTRILIVATASLKYNWADELDKWTTFTYTVLEGTPQKRQKILDEFNTEVLIVNYEQIKAHLDQLNTMDFRIVMFDEAHYIKNPTSKRTKVALKVVADRYFLITGSPLLNRVNELWTLLHRCDPATFPSYWRFRNRFCIYGGWQGKELIGVKNQTELKAHLANYMLRRRKVDVLDLPEKQIIPVMVDLTAHQRRLYDEAWKDMRITLPSDPDPMEIENGMVRFLRLKQICSTAANIPGLEDDSIKLDRLEEMVDEIVTEAGESVVVFTQFRGTLAAIECRLSGKYNIFTISGDTPPHRRVPTVTEWAAAKPAVLACMLQVAGVGLNMTAASKAIMVDKLFVPKLNEQAHDRLYRIGTDLTRPVQIFELIARRTIEQRIESILRSKTELFDELIETPAWKRDFFKAVMEEPDE